MIITDQEKLRFLSKVIMTESGCWGWFTRNGPLKKGYSKMVIAGRTESGHKVSWVIHNGPIPEGLIVMHRCDNTVCTNPDHLQVGTYKDNMTDMISKGRQVLATKTHCINGHEFTAENTRSDNFHRKVCVTCARLRAKLSQRKRRAMDRVINDDNNSSGLSPAPERE